MESKKRIKKRKKERKKEKKKNTSCVRYRLSHATETSRALLRLSIEIADKKKVPSLDRYDIVLECNCISFSSLYRI